MFLRPLRTAASLAPRLFASRAASTLSPVPLHSFRSRWLGVGVGAFAALAAGSAQSAASSCKAGPTFREADRLFAANEYQALAMLLRSALAAAPNDAELLWRLGRACKKLADSQPAKSPAKLALITEGFGATQKALAAAGQCGPAHKWHAILLTETGAFEGTSATIKNSFVVKEAHLVK